jgi:hypothetical protein
LYHRYVEEAQGDYVEKCQKQTEAGLYELHIQYHP